MANFQDSYLSGGNIDFIEGLYARYLEDPSNVDPSWRELFARNDGSGRPIFNTTPLEPATPVVPSKEAKGGKEAKSAPAGSAAVATAPQTAPTVAFEQDMKLQARVDQAISAFRLRGHLRAKLDPLGRPRPPLEHVADVGMVDDKHFSAAEQEQLVESSATSSPRRG